MGKQTEAFKQMHPEQFSDSVIVKKAVLNKDYFDFYLDSLTSRGQEKEFEKFRRYIAEIEICPNLLPQTGPTGGGDSKVDTETYPVSELVCQNWYIGYADTAATERWAFAISAKKEWKGKIKSDVEKINSVNQNAQRGYTKVFFMTNQYVSDKNRANMEDELRKKYSIDVRILDKTWLLEKTFKSEKSLKVAVESFNLSGNFIDEKQVGTNDYKRQLKYDDIENKMTSDFTKPSELIDLSYKSVELARELEFTELQILDLIERSNRIAKRYGVPANIAESIYNAAYTMFWWYSNEEKFYEYFKELERITLAENNSYIYKLYTILFINLYSIKDNEYVRFDEHKSRLIEKYDSFINNKSKPNAAIEASSAFQLVRIILGDSINDIVNTLIENIKSDKAYLDSILPSLSMMMERIPIFENADRYDELFELVVSSMSKQNEKITASLMLARRGSRLKETKPYDAMSYFSRTLISFYSNDNKKYLIQAVLDMADIYQKIGLMWAARNYYYYVFCLCLNQYFKYGSANKALVISALALRLMDLNLGNIMYAIVFDELYQISEKVYPEKLEINPDYFFQFDFFLANCILNTPYDIKCMLTKLPSYLEEHGLALSNAALKYEYGCYDETILHELNDSKEAFDDFIGKISEQDTNNIKHDPWYGIENSHILHTTVLGCEIELKISQPYENGAFEFGSTILATIECFLGTGVINYLISLIGKILINLVYQEDSEQYFNIIQSDSKPNSLEIDYKPFVFTDTVKIQTAFQEFIVNLISVIISIMFPYEPECSKIMQTIKESAAFERSCILANSVILGLGTLGSQIFSYHSLTQNCESIKIESTPHPVNDSYNKGSKKSDNININGVNIVYCNSTPDNIDLNSISNENIITSSIINPLLWDKSNWKGVCYGFKDCPIISLIFFDVSCRTIFEDWINEIGSIDKNDIIGIRIIKGIDKNHPTWYRISIGPQKLFGNNDNIQIMYTPYRIHTMQPNNNYNLNQFEQLIKNASGYRILPSYMVNETSTFVPLNELSLYKNISSLVIYNAYEIPSDDFLATSAILPTDDPVIPPGKETAFVLSDIARKRGNIK